MIYFITHLYFIASGDELHQKSFILKFFRLMISIRYYPTIISYKVVKYNKSNPTVLSTSNRVIAS